MKYVVVSLLCATGVATTAISATGDEPQSKEEVRASIEVAYPALASGSSADGARFPSDQVVKTASIDRKLDAALAQTSDGKLCFTGRSSGTCQAQERAINAGMFIAAIRCDAQGSSAKLIGVVPSGVTRVTVSGVNASPTPAGVVELEVRNPEFDSIELDNGHSHGLAISGKALC